MSVISRPGDVVYILKNERENYYWLATVATNRRESWLAARPYCKDKENFKKELQREGYRCAILCLTEIKR